ncbi:hypothetical protein VSDG_06847 [Cytospora chrysosperma]|uniref:Peptidase A1 domain-containing protein n=1 Tax=Cytospora chrysosperma TaxID=252740 RepID=A0A423VQU3_CYTCH|nr:hypothetical protein VSDG_06847 [Valsa sordida]
MKTSIRLALVGAFIHAASAVVQFPFAKHANTGHGSASSTTRRAVDTNLFWSDLTYVVNASIGTPGQTMSLVLSTSSSDTWVLDTRSDYCAYYLSSNLSSSYTPQDSSNDDDDYYYDYDFDVTYDDGTYAYGDYFNDTISLGSATVSDFTIGLVNETDMYIGELGIGFNDSTNSNLPDRLQEQGLIKSTAYSIWVDDEQASSGNLLFGAIDTTKFDGNLTRVSSYYSSYYKMAIQIASINGTTSDSGGPIAITYENTDDDSYSSSSDSSDYLFSAVFSPPDTVSNLPTEVASQIWDMAGAYYDSDLGLAVISCTSAGDTTTNFTLQLGQGTYGPIIAATLADLVISTEDIPLSSYYSSYFSDDDGLCLFGVQNSTDGVSTYSSNYNLGSTLLRRTYTVLDLVNQEIAVAPVKFGATATSNIVEFASYGASVPSSTLHCIYSSCYETTSDGTGSDDAEGTGLPAGILSVPALAGLSVGIAIGALLLGIAGFLVWRHRLNKASSASTSAEAGQALPLMQSGSAAEGGPGAAPEMAQANVGKGKGPEVPMPAALGSVGGSHGAYDAAPETSAAHDTSAAHETGGFHDAGAVHSSTALGLTHEAIPLFSDQHLPSNRVGLVHRRLRPGEPLPCINKVINRGATPHRHVDHDGVVHGLGRGARPAVGEHGQHDAEDEEGDGGPGDGEAEPVARVKGPGRELVAAPDRPREDGQAPGQVVAGHGEGEERGRGGRGDQAQQAEDDGHEHGAPDCAEGDVAEGLGLRRVSVLGPSVAIDQLGGRKRVVGWTYDGPEERGEGEGTVPGEGPHLARGGNEDGKAHEVLDDEEEGYEPHGSVLAKGVVVDLGHLQQRLSASRGLGRSC